MFLFRASRALLIPYLLLSASPARAKMEFPPKFTSADEKIAYAREIIAVAPAVGTVLNIEGVAQVVDAEAALVAKLQADQKFMAAAMAKPDLQTFKIQKVDARDSKVIDELILREIPPRIAIFRGCVGGDCATTHSWSYPYSPFERYYFLETPNGQIIGYVSGAITIVKGQPCFYVRDLVGPNLKIDQISTVLYSLFLGREMLGVKQMTLMPSEFAHENVYPAQEAALRAITTTGIVEQIFQDETFRRDYLDPAVSEPQYDRVERHKLARYFEVNEKVLNSYRITLLNGPVADKPKNPSDLFWEFIDGAAASDDAETLRLNVDPERNWQPLLAVLRNEARLPLERFYKKAKEECERFGFALSQNRVRRHDEMFRVGHLNAPDAFSVKDARQLRQTMRYVRTMFWNPLTMEAALHFITDHGALMESHEVMVGGFASLFERRTAGDANRLVRLWKAGIRFENVELTVADLDWAINHVNNYTVVRALYQLRLEKTSTSCEQRLGDKSKRNAR